MIRDRAMRVWATALLLLLPDMAAAALDTTGLRPARAGPAPRMILANSVTRWRPLTRDAARRFGVPLAWIERVIRAESGGQTRLAGRPITSPAGAMGLMQLMPATWSALRRRLSLGPDPHDPRDNILAGTCYLRLMYDRFGYPGLFGAYHAGPARYAAWLAGREALPVATRAYLASVAPAADAAPHAARSTGAPAPRAALFAIARDGAPSLETLPASTALFVVRRSPSAASGAAFPLPRSDGARP